jgi:hypothetical protein
VAGELAPVAALAAAAVLVAVLAPAAARALAAVLTLAQAPAAAVVVVRLVRVWGRA